MSATILQEISEKLQQGKAKDIKVLVPQALEAGLPATDILNDGLLAGMSVIGVKFKNNEVFVPEVHDIGKNLVKMMMEGKGLEVIDLGVDVSPEAFVSAAKEHGAGIIACSALLTTTMGEMKNVVDLCVAEGIRDKVKIMIGGAPITDAYCKEIGADAYTSDAASAAEVALSFFTA